MINNTKIVLFFRKKTTGAFSIDQIFESLASEISKSFNLVSYSLDKAGGSLSKVIANIIEAITHSSDGINHITGDVHYIALGLFKGRTVLTIHDCVLLSRTSRFNIKFYIYLWLWYKIPILMADIVTTISEKSKDEIIKYSKCPVEKIVVIPNSVNEVFKYCPKNFNKGCPIILQVGTYPNKNIENVVKSLKGLPCILEIIGPLTNIHYQLLHANQINFRNYSNLTINELAKHYAHADIVIFASIYEGFGMPIIEAQATGRPVITSNIEPMPWVAGANGACFIDPIDPVSIRDGVLRIISDDYYRHQLVSTGLNNVKRFSIQNIAKQYIKLYQSLCVE